MSKLFLVLFLTLISAAAFAETHTVVMKSISYDPKKVTVKVGDAVEWANKSYTPHSATAESSGAQTDGFDTGLVEPKKTSKKIKFEKPGTFSYHCSVHGKSMSGVIVVQP